ncbi:hypothetical protein [Nocardia sp. NPDC003345]
MTLHWLDKSALTCPYPRSGHRPDTVPATRVVLRRGRIGIPATVACDTCAAELRAFEEYRGVPVAVISLDDAPDLPAPCRSFWRSHACSLQAGHDEGPGPTPHRCTCGAHPGPTPAVTGAAGASGDVGSLSA